MTTTTAPALPRLHPLAMTFVVIGFVYLLACVVALSLLIASLAAETASMTAALPAIALLLGWAVLFYPVVLSLFRVSADLRMRAAARAHPGAFLLQVVARPTTAAQWRSAAHALGVPARGLPWNNYAVVVADPAALRLYAGNLVATERVALPTARLVSVRPESRTIGIRTLQCIVLGLADSANLVREVELVPLRWTGILMRAMPPEQVPAELAAMQHATHPGL